MSKKYRFRKMFFICTDNVVIADNVHMTNAHQHRDKAEAIAEQPRGSHYMWEDESKPVPVQKVEGFYLVHESLYDEIIKPHDKEAKD